MAVSEQISEKLEKLPVAIQQEVLDFVDFVSERVKHQNVAEEDEQWQDLSLSQAMKGLEDEASPEYTEADLKETWR